MQAAELRVECRAHQSRKRPVPLNDFIWPAMRLMPLTARSELVKVVGVAPTELQELGDGFQSQPTT